MTMARSADTSLAYIADANPAEILPQFLAWCVAACINDSIAGKLSDRIAEAKGGSRFLSDLFDALVEYFIYRAVGALSSLKAGEQSGELSDSHS